jgi:hypothetical protein
MPIDARRSAHRSAHLGGIDHRQLGSSDPQSDAGYGRIIFLD